MTERKLFLDLDGVMADFDTAAKRHLKTDHDVYRWEFIHGADELWSRLNSISNFFADLPMCEHAEWMWSVIKHLNPTILTALPRSNPDNVERQKRQWVSNRLGKGVPVITCFTRDKPKFCETGSILIDDRAVNRSDWEAKGGLLLLHTAPANTIGVLRAIGVLT